MGSGGAGDVTAAANIGDTKVVVGSGGAKGVAASSLNAAVTKMTAGVPSAAAYTDLVGLWTTCTGALKSDGTCSALGTAAGATLGTGAGQVPVTGEYEPNDADLTAIAALSCTENQIIKRNGAGAWECAADATAGSPTFDGIGSGTNTAAAMVVGTGASLGATGTGTIVATSASGNAGTATALAANGANCDAGNAPLGVDASGAVEGCWAVQAALTGPMTQAVENSADNTLSKGVGTSGRAFEKTGITVDDSNNMVVPGSISSGDGAVAGESLLYELAANGSNYRSWLAPDALTATVQLKHADAAPAGSIMVFPAPTGTVSQYAWQGVATANTASTIVARDGSGNFTAGTITATLTGNADTVTNGMTQAVENSADNTVPVGVGTSGRAFEKTPVTIDPSTGAIASAVIDVEGTGNVLTTVSKIWLQAVNCDGTTASLNWDTIATLKPAAACSAGTTNTGLIRGLAAFSNSEVSQMQTHFALPSDWTGAIDLAFKWQTSATSGSVVWQAATVCVADAEVNDAAWNTASTVTDAAKGTTLQTNDAAITGLTATGCAAGELLHLKVFRDPEHANDDLAATADLIGVMVTMRRAQ